MVSQDLQSFFILDGSTLIRIALTTPPAAASDATLQSLSCTTALPKTALTQVTVKNASLLDLCEPLVPALSQEYVPVVTGANTVQVVNLRTGALADLCAAQTLPLSSSEQMACVALAARASTHDVVGAAARCEVAGGGDAVRRGGAAAGADAAGAAAGAAACCAGVPAALPRGAAL